MTSPFSIAFQLIPAYYVNVYYAGLGSIKSASHRFATRLSSHVAVFSLPCDLIDCQQPTGLGYPCQRHYLLLLLLYGVHFKHEVYVIPVFYHE